MALSMAKRVEKVNLVMAKHAVPANLKAQVKFELDNSGSAIPMYQDGTMQELTERLMAVALRLDADGKLEVYSFSSSAHKHGDVTADDIDGYIKARFIPESQKAGTWAGGTDYAVAAKACLSEETEPAASKKSKGLFGFFGKKTEEQQPTTAPATDYPGLHMFLSDGQDMGNSNEFRRLISTAKNNYFILIGVGGSQNFNLMKRCADEYDNVGFVHFDNLSISDDVMYEQLLAKEAIDWLKAHQPATN